MRRTSFTRSQHSISLAYWFGVVCVPMLAYGARALGTTADDLCAANADPCVVDRRISVTDGSTLALGPRNLVIANNGSLSVGAGTMTITAASVTVEGGGTIAANGRGPGGKITVMAGTILVGGIVAADGTDGGSISLSAAQELISNGSISANGTNGTGVGGNIELSGRSLSIAGDITARGTADGLGGGCVTLSADTDIDLYGSIRVSGSDGGDVAIFAGVAAGNLRLHPELEQPVSITTSGIGTNGGSGGIIELSAQGDGINTGHIELGGNIQSRGAGNQGGDGGCITVTAAGNITSSYNSQHPTLLDVNSGSPDGFAGEICLTATGNIVLDVRLNAQGSGSEGAGGDVEVRAGADLTINEHAAISVIGPGDGGSIDLAADHGDISIASTRVDASGNLGGDGGDVTVRASGEHSDITIAGAVLANGSAFGAAPGRAGSIQIIAGYSLVLQGPPTQAGGRLQAQSGNGGGNGGAIALRTLRGPLQVSGGVLAPGLGSTSTGGMVAISGGGPVNVDGDIDVSSPFQGGHVGIEASGSIDISGNVIASGEASATGNGGTIEVTSAGAVSIAGELSADGGTTTGTHAGSVTASGCDLTIPDGGLLSVTGATGVNRLRGRRLIMVGGDLAADPNTGRNELVYRDATQPPVVFGGASIVPPAVLILDATLPACSVCGNQQIEPPETCDDGNQDDGDGCSSTCQIEAAQCDVDGDGDVDVSDLTALEIELFDGDGDRTIDVGGGSFPGSVGADANTDGRITSADLTRCIEVLGQQ